MLNLGLNIALIPIYGIIGVAIATASSTVLSNILMFGEVWKKEGVISVPYRKLLKVTVLGLIPLSAVYILDALLFADTPMWFLFVAGILYYLLYTLLFLKILGLGEEEKKVFLRVGEKTGFEEEIEKILDYLS